jgi:hypothetical protein
MRSIMLCVHNQVCVARAIARSVDQKPKLSQGVRTHTNFLITKAITTVTPMLIEFQPKNQNELEWPVVVRGDSSPNTGYG